MIRLASFLILLNAVALVCSATAARADYEWLPGDGLPGLDSHGRAMTVWDDGSGPALYVGGLFTRAGDVYASGIAKWDGARWLPLGGGINGSVLALAVYDGELVAGGVFTIAGGVSANCIAKWNGTSWSPLDSGIGGGTYRMGVQAMAVHNGELIAAGDFTLAGGVSTVNIAAWNGTSWSSMCISMTGKDNYTSVRALAIFNGELIAGGDFIIVNGIAVNGIVRRNGEQWLPFGEGTRQTSWNYDPCCCGDPNCSYWPCPPCPEIAPGEIYTLSAAGEELLAGGRFDKVDGISANGVAKWNGTSWSPLGSGVDGDISTLVVFNDEVVAGGAFTAAGGVGAKNIAKWNGTSWSALGNGLTSQTMSHPPRVTLTVFSGELIVTGELRTAGGVGVLYIAKWDAGSWSPLCGGLNWRVRALTKFEGDLIAGGDFTTAGMGSANRIAKWDGSNWSPLDSGIASPSGAIVYSLTVLGSKLIAGGQFATAGGVSASNIAEWDGSSWSALGSGMNGTVRALSVCNNKLVAAGRFARAGGVVVNNIAEWNGSGWSPLGSGVSGGTYTCVYAMTVLNGELIVGGDFTVAGGVSVKNIAKWNGTSWSAMGSEAIGKVEAITVFNGEVIAGWCRWNGTAWRTLGYGAGMNGSIRALLPFKNKLIAGGSFTTACGVSTNYIASWNGTSWAPLGSGMTSWGEVAVYALGVFGGELIAGGDFLSAGDYPSAYWARWGLLGDVNCDGVINGADVGVFATALVDPAGYRAAYDCDIQIADMNADRQIDLEDVQGFVAAILAQ